MSGSSRSDAAAIWKAAWSKGAADFPYVEHTPTARSTLLKPNPDIERLEAEVYEPVKRSVAEVAELVSTSASLAEGPVSKNAIIPTGTYGSSDASHSSIPYHCFLDAFDQPKFRQKVANDTWAQLRDFRPALVPWRWNLGIRSTNPTNTVAKNGRCGYSRAFEERNQNASMTTAQVGGGKSEVRFDCSRCSQHHRAYVPNHFFLLLGAGYLSQKQCLKVMLSLLYCSAL